LCAIIVIKKIVYSFHTFGFQQPNEQQASKTTNF